jgi:hypothetical protein
MKIFNDPHRESNLRPIAVPGPTAPPRIPILCMLNLILSLGSHKFRILSN